MRSVFLLLILIVSQPASAQNQENYRQIYDKMMNAMNKVQTCTYTLIMQERIFDEYLVGKLKVKLHVKPYKTYVYSLSPNEGAEVLYIQGENNDKALINPNTFPYINVNLSIFHSMFRKNHQYTADKMGFRYLYDILRQYEAKEKEKFYSNLKVKTDPSEETKSYYILEIDNSEFGFMNYKVMKDEDISQIAEKFFLNDQMILDLNRDIDYFDDVDEGQVITIPNSFAKRIVFYVDKKTMLPLTQIIYDHKGLYSKIEFTSFVLNPVFAPDEFSRYNKKYNF